MYWNVTQCFALESMTFSPSFLFVYWSWLRYLNCVTPWKSKPSDVRLSYPIWVLIGSQRAFAVLYKFRTWAIEDFIPCNVAVETETNAFPLIENRWWQRCCNSTVESKSARGFWNFNVFWINFFASMFIFLIYS